MRFRGCHIFGGELILQFPLYLVRVHVSDVKTEVAFLRPISGLSAAPASVGSGLGLPCCVYVHWDGVTQGWVGVGEVRGRCSWGGLGYCQRAVHGGSRDVGLSVRDMKSLICHAVLIHPDCETEPAFRVGTFRMPFLQGPSRFCGQVLGRT